MTREELRAKCAGLMGWKLDPNITETDPPCPAYIGAGGVAEWFKCEYYPDSDPAQAMELLIYVCRDGWNVGNGVVYIWVPGGENVREMHNNTLSGIALAICKAVCRAKGIDVGEVE